MFGAWNILNGLQSIGPASEFFLFFGFNLKTNKITKQKKEGGEKRV